MVHGETNAPRPLFIGRAGAVGGEATIFVGSKKERMLVVQEVMVVKTTATVWIRPTRKTVFQLPVSETAQIS